MTGQFYSNVGASNGTRDPLDVYETPGYVTRTLLRHVRLCGPVLEPAQASGKISRVLRAAGFDVEGRDIRSGQDFLEECGTWRGDLVTNPPYKDALAFVEKSLEVADGQVALLMRSGFLWSDNRRTLFSTNPPELVLVMPDRIMFIKRDGTPIDGQAHSHAWLTWPSRALRQPGLITRLEWAEDLRDG